MAETKIEWADYTFNPWVGCTKVSAACKHCYAESLVRRRPALVLGHSMVPQKALPLWGDDAPRRITSDLNWSLPKRWNRAATRAGQRRRVFCASLADVFERRPGPASCDELDEPRARLWAVIDATPYLDWMLLTKRPENVLSMVPAKWLNSGWPINAWVGTTIENQEMLAARMGHLITIPAPVRFVSAEPLLSALDFRAWLPPPLPDYAQRANCQPRIFVGCPECGAPGHISCQRWIWNAKAAMAHAGIDWIIVGGESGHHARPMHPGWARDLRDQCAARIPFFFKQWGEWAPVCDVHCEDPDDAFRSADVDPTSDGIVAIQLNGDQPQGMGGPEGDWCDHMPSPGSWWMVRVGKKAAGRLLDGVEYSQFPGSAL